MSAAPLSEPVVTPVPLGAFVVATAAAGEAAAFALGDGTLAIVRGGAVRRVTVNPKGALLSLGAHDGGFVTGDDAGQLARVTPDGAVEVIETLKGKWIEPVITHAGRKAIAFAAGREVVVIDGKGRRALGPHPSTVAAIAFSPDGSRIAAAHYGGITIHVHDRPDLAPRKLTWKGSHIAVAYAPNGKFVATAMQENCLHVWRLANGADMQMRGYAQKPKSVAWTPDSLFLGSGGTDAMVLWPFAGDGPEGKPPVEFGIREGISATMVAGHPTRKLILTGWDDGAVSMADPERKRATVMHKAGGPITALGFDAAGARALYGSETGEAGIIDLPGLGK